MTPAPPAARASPAMRKSSTPVITSRRAKAGSLPGRSVRRCMPRLSLRCSAAATDQRPAAAIDAASRVRSRSSPSPCRWSRTSRQTLSSRSPLFSRPVPVRKKFLSSGVHLVAHRRRSPRLRRCRLAAMPPGAGRPGRAAATSLRKALPAAAPGMGRGALAGPPAAGERPGRIDGAAARHRTGHDLAAGGVAGDIEAGHAGGAVVGDDVDAAGAAHRAFGAQA